MRTLFALLFTLILAIFAGKPVGDPPTPPFGCPPIASCQPVQPEDPQPPGIDPPPALEEV